MQHCRSNVSPYRHTKPVSRRPYKANQLTQAVINKCVQDMLNNDIIKERSSPWGSPVTIVALYTRLEGLLEKNVSPLGRRGVDQHHSGARKGDIRCCIISEDKKTSDLNFIPESPHQNPEKNK